MAVWSTVKLSALGGAFRLDPEFWRPEYVRVERAIKRLPHKKIGDISHSLRKGVFNILAESYVEEGVPFYRSSNVGAIVPKSADLVYISEQRHAEEQKTALKRGDIMLAKTGKEAASVVLVQECNVSQDVVALRPDRTQVNPFYLAVFLNTEPGILQMRRWFQGQVQMHLSLPDTREILVPLPDPKHQSAVESLVVESEAMESSAHIAIAAAETHLMEALGMDHLDLAPEKCYIRRFRDLHAGNRFGAEYYMPCKKRVLDALAKLPHRTIADHAPAIREMWDPTRASEEEWVRNFDITDALEPFIDDAAEPQSAAEIGSTKKRFRAGDVVISRLRSYLKEIAVVRTSDALPAVGSSEFIVLRPTGHGLSAETLMVFLRCPLVQTILQWSQDGSNHPRFAEEDLLAVPVPDAALRVQKKIDALVQEATDARRGAARLLEQAKRTVEDMIAGEASGDEK